jgi:hypothetical protein
MKVDLMKQPLVVEVYARNASDYVHIQEIGPDRAKFDECSIRKAIDYVLDHYVDEGATSRDVKAEIEEIINDHDSHWFSINGKKIVAEKDAKGNVLIDHRDGEFNNSDYLKELSDDDNNPYLISEIRIFDGKVQINN